MRLGRGAGERRRRRTGGKFNGAKFIQFRCRCDWGEGREDCDGGGGRGGEEGEKEGCLCGGCGRRGRGGGGVFVWGMCAGVENSFSTYARRRVACSSKDYGEL